MDKKRLNIGVVCYPTFGGSGVVATELGMALAQKGHDVHFITYQRPARLSSFQEHVYYHEVSPIDYPLFEYPPYESALASKLVDVARYEDLDLLHVHYAVPHAAVAYMAKKVLLAHNKYLPVVTTLHGTDITLVGRDRSFAPIVEFSINKSDAVTVVSEALKQETLSHFNISTEIEVIYNFIDFNRFSKQDKSHFKKAVAPEGEFVISHTSNFRKVKRVSDVIEVFYRINQKLPSKLLLIGDGPERAALERRTRELNLWEHVRFLGKQDAVEELLAISDLYILPSANESFGLSALEAMACQVPVISSNIGGLPEVNTHGKTGFLSDVGDVDDMAKNAIYILEDPQRYEKFSKNALARAKEFAIDNILPEYESLYYQMVEEKVKA